MLGNANDVKGFHNLYGVDIQADSRGRSGDFLSYETGIEAGAKQRCVTLPAGGFKFSGIPDAVIGGITVPVDGDEVFPGSQQPADILVVTSVGKLDSRGMNHDISIQGQNFIFAAGCNHAGYTTSGNITGILAGLGFAVHIQSHQLQVRMIDHSP